MHNVYHLFMDDFDRDHKFICRVLYSCKTLDQITTAREWSSVYYARRVKRLVIADYFNWISDWIGQILSKNEQNGTKNTF